MQNCQLVVIGAGGHAKVVIQTARAAGFEVTDIYDDAGHEAGAVVLGVPIRGPIAAVPSDQLAIIAIGDNETRHRVAATVTCEWTTIVHPTAIVDATATIGPGTAIFAGTVIQADAKLGSHVIVNTGSSIDHDSIVGDCCHVGPGARVCGDVTVGSGTLLGVGASVSPGVSIGDRCVIGAGAAVVHDVAPDSTAVGIPARTVTT